MKCYDTISSKSRFQYTETPKCSTAYFNQQCINLYNSAETSARFSPFIPPVKFQKSYLREEDKPRASTLHPRRATRLSCLTRKGGINEELIGVPPLLPFPNPNDKRHSLALRPQFV